MILLLSLLAAATPPAAAALELAGLRVRAGFEGVTAVEHPEPSAEWGPGEQRSWSKSSTIGATLRVVETVPQRPASSLQGYLSRWRARHGCTAKELRLPRLHRGPELDFEGSCKGGDVYVIKVLLAKGRVYELHADTWAGGPVVNLRAAIEAFLGTVEIRSFAN